MNTRDALEVVRSVTEWGEANTLKFASKLHAGMFSFKRMIEVSPVVVLYRRPYCPSFNGYEHNEVFGEYIDTPNGYVPHGYRVYQSVAYPNHPLAISTWRYGVETGAGVFVDYWNNRVKFVYRAYSKVIATGDVWHEDYIEPDFIQGYQKIAYMSREK